MAGDQGAQGKTWIARHHAEMLFLFGLAGLGYETIVVNYDRPWLLVIFGGAAGILPANAVDAILRARGK